MEGFGLKPLRLEFNAVGLVPEHQYRDQAIANAQAGYPTIQMAGPHQTPLAVVGGGPSAAVALPELKDWKGHIWAINQSASWLSHMAPRALTWLFTVDPDELMASPQYTVGVERAILASSCHPKLFEALRDKPVQMFHTYELPDVECMNFGGPSSVCRTFLPALWMGYTDVTYFGCEGSFEDATHAYRDETRPNQMIVRAGGVDYVTTPDLYLTTQYLADVIREFPKVLKEKSGGLLRAMIEHPDSWEVVALSSALRDKLDPTATVLYDQP